MSLPIRNVMVMALVGLVLGGCRATPAQPGGHAASDDASEVGTESRIHPVFRSMALDADPPTLEAPTTIPGAFDFQHRGPLEFLDFLAARAASADDPHRIPMYTVNGTHRGWIRVDDLPDLLALFDSSTPCASVAKEISSFATEEPSTVGHEAAFLVAGFRAEVDRTGYGGYPDRLNSAGAALDREELRAWGERYAALGSNPRD